jgi:tripartite-type tricarboxylate transporter receptor subunit TctC
MAGIDVLEVPYRGSSLILNDLVAGHVPLGWVSPLSMVPHLEGGRLRPLGVTTTTRTRLLPDVPPIAEAGLPGYDCAGLYGILGPAGMPREIVARMHGAIERVMADPAVQDRFGRLGVDVDLVGPAGLGEFLERDDQLWAQAAREGLVPRSH